MSVADQITRLNTAKADIKTAIEAKGVTVPSTAKIDVYDDYIAQIQQGEDRSEYWTHDWKFKRPADWPDLDEFDIAHATNTIVMTYDCRDRIAHPNDNNDHFHVKCSNSGSVIERYKVVNGEFVLAWTTTTTASNEVVSHLLPTNEGDYVVYKLYHSNTWHRYFWGGDASRGDDGFLSEFNNKILEIQGNDAGFAGAFFCWRSHSLRRLLWYSYSGKPMYLYSNCCGWNSIEHIEFKTPWYVSGNQSGWFNYSLLREMNFNNFIFSDSAVNLQNCFMCCPQLEEINFGQNFPNVNAITGAFSYCSKLKTADFYNLSITSSVTYYGSVFTRCDSIETIDINTWDFSAATSISQLFSYCYKLKEVVFGSYNFGNVKNASNMFYYCYNLRQCPLSGKTIDFSKCTNFK